ncbi:MAG: DoxX family protein [Saprospiraceae bacterium]
MHCEEHVETIIFVKKKLTAEIKAALGKISLLILSVGFLGVGMLKLISYPSLVVSFQKWHLPAWFIYVVGLSELCIAVALFYAPWRKKTIVAAAILMVGAITVHMMAGEVSQLYGPVVVLFLLAVLWVSEPSQ